MFDYSYQPILVGLDFTEMDLNIFSFLKENGKALTNESIHFIHVNENQKIENVDADKLVEKIKAQVPEGFKSEAQVVDGDAEKEIAAYKKSHGINLLVLGHKISRSHSIEMKRLVKKSTCSLLLVPKKEAYITKKICVALDFSDVSLAALKAAKQIATGTSASIIGLHCYQIPSGYHKSGRDHEEFAQIMENNAKKDASDFLKQADMEEIPMEYIYDKEEEPANAIADFAKQNEIDMVVIGSKGRTDAASILMGSVAKSLTQQHYQTPILIIKEKNQNMDVVDALKKV